MERLAIEGIGPSPTPSRGNQCIVVMADYFSKWAEVIATPDQVARTIADVCVRQLVVHQVQSTQNDSHGSHIFADMCKLQLIRKMRGKMYHHGRSGIMPSTLRERHTELAV